MHRAWWDHMVGLSSSGPAGVPLAILPFLWSPCQSSTYLLPQNSGWLLTRFILSVPSRYSAAFLCEDEGRLIPVLFCNAQEHLIARRQKSLAREGSSQASLVGKGADAVVTSGRQAALSRCEQPWHPSPSVLNSTQASQLNITRLLHRSPQYICAPPPPPAPWNRHYYNDYYCLSGWCVQNKALVRSGFVLVFVSAGLWLCHGCNEEAYQLCANKPSGKDTSADNEQQVGSHTLHPWFSAA